MSGLLRRLSRRPSAALGAALLGGVLLLCAVGELLSPYAPAQQHRERAYHPPMLSWLRVREPSGGPLHLPFVCASRPGPAPGAYLEDCSERYPLRLLVPGEERRLLGLIPLQRALVGVAPPGALHWLGTDRFGRDLLARSLSGGRASLAVGLAATALALALALAVGGLAGQFGGLTDFVAMRAVELSLALPGLYLLLVLSETLGSRLRGPGLALALALLGWAAQARVLRGMVLSLRERDSVRAARVQGFSELRILLGQVLPATLPYVQAAAVLALPQFVLGEVALSFLGLGLQEPAASWGLLLRDAQSLRALRDFPWLLAPGLLLFVAVLGGQLLGEALRDAADPRADEGRP